MNHFLNPNQTVPFFIAYILMQVLKRLLTRPAAFRITVLTKVYFTLSKIITQG